MLGMLTDILKLSASSVIWGVLIALVMMMLFVLIVRGWWKDAVFTPATYILGGLLALLLMFQCTMIVGALKVINMTDEYETVMQNVVDTSYSMLDRVATPEETDAVVGQLIGQVPLLQHYISGAWSEGTTLRELPRVLGDELRSVMRSYVVRRLLWCLGFVIVLGVLSYKTIRRRSYQSDSYLYDGDGDTMSASSYLDSY